MYLAEINENNIFLALSKNHQVVGFAPFTVNQQKRVVFNCDSLPPGMANVTLFNESIQPIAERALFIPQKDAPHFCVTTESGFYHPEQQTTLGVEITGNNKNCSGIFSIGVIDSATALSPQINLLSIKDCFLFEEAFYMRIPFHIKQKGLSNLAAKELDLIFLTYGWTKFNPEIPEKQKNQKPINYDRYKIEITQTHLSRKRRKINNSKEPLLALSMDEPAILGLNKGKGNSFLLSIDSIPWLTNKLMLVPNFALKNKINAASLNPVVNEDYLKSFKYQKENKEIFNQAPQSINNEPVFDLDSFRVLKEISVTAKRESAKKFVNEYEKRYRGVSAKTLDQNTIELVMTLEDLLRKLNPRTLNTGIKTIYFRPTTRIQGDPPPALFVLDGVPQETNYKTLLDLNPKYLHSVTALEGVSGFYIYGEEAMGGIVFIETKFNHIGDEYELSSNEKTFSGDLRKIIELFRSNKEFYNPPQVVIQNDPELWVRPTLYWNHEVFYDGKTPVRIQYYNHKKKGTVFIVLNGVTEEGEPVSGIHKYQVK